MKKTIKVSYEKTSSLGLKESKISSTLNWYLHCKCEIGPYLVFSCSPH